MIVVKSIYTYQYAKGAGLQAGREVNYLILQHRREKLKRPVLQVSGVKAGDGPAEIVFSTINTRKA